MYCLDVRIQRNKMYKANQKVGVCNWGNVLTQLPVYCTILFDFCIIDRSPLSPSTVAGSHALPSPVTPGTSGGTLTTPTKKTHQRSKSDATAAITAASSRLMQVSHVNEYYYYWCTLINVHEFPAVKLVIESNKALAEVPVERNNCLSHASLYIVFINNGKLETQVITLYLFSC